MYVSQVPPPPGGVDQDVVHFHKCVFERPIAILISNEQWPFKQRLFSCLYTVYVLFICRNDEEWHRHRSALNPKLLNIKQVEHYSSDFNVVIDKLMIKLMSMRNKDLEIEHIEKQLFRWSLESMPLILFVRSLSPSLVPEHILPSNFRGEKI